MAVRTEAARVLDTVERAEMRDTDTRSGRRLSARWPATLEEPSAMLAAELIAPLVVPNSSFSQSSPSRSATPAAAVRRA